MSFWSSSSRRRETGPFGSHFPATGTARIVPFSKVTSSSAYAHENPVSKMRIPDPFRPPASVGWNRISATRCASSSAGGAHSGWGGHVGSEVDVAAAAELAAGSGGVDLSRHAPSAKGDTASAAHTREARRERTRGV